MDQAAPPPPNRLLPAPHHATLFWLWLTILDIAGVLAIAFGVVLGQYIQTTLLGVGILLITVTALVNHRHNHDHRWLLATAAVLTVAVAFLRGLVIYAPN